MEDTRRFLTCATPSSSSSLNSTGNWHSILSPFREGFPRYVLPSFVGLWFPSVFSSFTTNTNPPIRGQGALGRPTDKEGDAQTDEGGRKVLGRQMNRAVSIRGFIHPASPRTLSAPSCRDGHRCYPSFALIFHLDSILKRSRLYRYRNLSLLLALSVLPHK